MKYTQTLCFYALVTMTLIFGLSHVASAGEKNMDLSLCAPGQVFSIDIDNPYIMFYPVGRQSRLVGEEDDEIIIVRITVLDETELLYEFPNEVETRVVEELEAIDANEDGVIQNDEVIEQSFNYYAQTLDGTVCYFGEEVWEPAEEAVSSLFDNGDEPVPGVPVDGLERNEDGEWRADEEFSSPGVFFPASEKALPGTKFQQENGPPDALDEMKIVGTGAVLLEDITIDGEEFEEVLFEDVRRGREYNPVDGDKGYKSFAAGLGLILDEDFQLKDVSLP